MSTTTTTAQQQQKTNSKRMKNWNIVNNTHDNLSCTQYVSVVVCVYVFLSIMLYSVAVTLFYFDWFQLEL